MPKSVALGPRRRECAGAHWRRRIFQYLLNHHVHRHCVVVEMVFEADAAGDVCIQEAYGLGLEALGEIQSKIKWGPTQTHQ